MTEFYNSVLADSRIIYESLEWLVISLSSRIDIVNLKRYFSDIYFSSCSGLSHVKRREEETDTSNIVNDHFVREFENQFILQRVIKESKLALKLIERFLILFRTFLLLLSCNKTEDKKLFFIE